MTPKLSIYSETNNRLHNEDVFHVHVDDDVIATVLADGFSKIDAEGQTGKDVAELAATTFKEFIPALTASFGSKGNPETVLAGVNLKVRKTCRDFYSGSTFAIAALGLGALKKNGESRLYTSVLGNSIVLCFEPGQDFETIFIAGKAIIQMGGLHLFGRVGDRKWSIHHQGIEPVIESTIVRKSSILLMFTDGIVAQSGDKPDDLYPHEVFDCLKAIVRSAEEGADAKDIVRNAIQNGSKDNVTAVVMRF